MNVNEWLGEDNILGQDIWHKKYQYENESLDEWFDRVSNGDEKLKQLIKDKKFLFGGRTLTNRNVIGSGNYFNCFSAGYIEDDYSKIMDALKEIGITFKTEGGQGISLSKLRPKGTPIGNSCESDGIIPFMEMFNCVTEGTMQGGHRRGALMISLDIRHKESKNFITIKTNKDEITKANLSLEIDDEFMNAVKTYYDQGKTITLHETKDYAGHIVKYDIVPIELYKLMMKTVYDYAEPGCIFTNQFRNYNFMEYVNDYNIETCNPCGEQPLKKQSCCNLGSLNLYEFVENKFTSDAHVNMKKLDEAIEIVSNALDIIIDENTHRLPKEMKEYKNNAEQWRNIGLGVYGYADMLMALELKYGSDEAIAFSDELFDKIMFSAIKYNIKRAKEKESFSKCNDDIKNNIVKSLIFFNHIGINSDGYTAMTLNDFKKYGFRNCSLLSIAPTGSIATMQNRSGGTEPEFSLSYIRRTDNLEESYKVEANVVNDYRKITGNQGKLPDYFVTSEEISWKDRIDTQAVIQKHIDTAISSTVNLPNNTTLKDIEKLYLYAWEKGLKGITVYRAGCKREGILIDNKSSESEPIDTDNTPTTLSRGDILNVYDDLVGEKRKITSGCGSFHLEAYFDELTAEPMETFINIGSSGSCERNLQLISRLISIALRGGIPIECIIDQCKSIKPCPAYVSRTIKKGDTSKGASCPNAIGFALEELYSKAKDLYLIDADSDDTTTHEMSDYIINMIKDQSIQTENTTPTVELITNQKCPECGEPIREEGGCQICPACGWSKCD